MSEAQVTEVGWNWAVGAHTVSCTAGAMDSLAQNAYDDGQEIPTWHTDIVWGMTVAEIIAMWLSDGTVECRCND